MCYEDQGRHGPWCEDQPWRLDTEHDLHTLVRLLYDFIEIMTLLLSTEPVKMFRISECAVGAQYWCIHSSLWGKLQQEMITHKEWRQRDWAARCFSLILLMNKEYRVEWKCLIVSWLCVLIMMYITITCYSPHSSQASKLLFITWLAFCVYI